MDSRRKYYTLHYETRIEKALLYLFSFNTRKKRVLNKRKDKWNKLSRVCKLYTVGKLISSPKGSGIKGNTSSVGERSNEGKLWNEWKKGTVGRRSLGRKEDNGACWRNRLMIKNCLRRKETEDAGDGEERENGKGMVSHWGGKYGREKKRPWG